MNFLREIEGFDQASIFIQLSLMFFNDPQQILLKLMNGLDHLCEAQK